MGKSGCIDGNGILPADSAAGGEECGRIQNRSRKKYDEYKSKYTYQREEELGFRCLVIAKQNTINQAAHTVGKHLPGCPWALRIEEVAGECGNCTGHKARLRAECNAGNHNNCRNSLEIRNRNRYSSGNSQSCHYRNANKLSCLGFSSFKSQKERKHGFDNDQRAGQIVALATQFCS